MSASTNRSTRAALEGKVTAAANAAVAARVFRQWSNEQERAVEVRTRSDAVVVGSRGRVDDGIIDRASGMSGDDGIRANRVVVVVVGEVAWLSPEGTTYFTGKVANQREDTVMTSRHRRTTEVLAALEVVMRQRVTWSQWAGRRCGVDEGTLSPTQRTTSEGEILCGCKPRRWRIAARRSLGEIVNKDS